MKTKPLVFLILSFAAFACAAFFAFASMSTQSIGQVGVPIALVFIFIGLTNGVIFNFTRELVKRLDGEGKE